MANRVKIKMCGMTNSADVAYASQLGVDAIGIIFYPKSSRYVTLNQAKLLLSECPLMTTIVAVFVNPNVSDVEQVLDELPVQWLQFHGDESPSFCQSFNKPYIKAIAALSMRKITQAMQIYHSAAAFLLDTPSIARGGSGQIFDWQIIPTQRSKPIILAGGLDACNVKQAIEHGIPDIVDVCSGVECQPGLKDHQKMRQFVNGVNDKTNDTYPI